MKLEDIKNHWSDWAETYGVNLRATTKTSTAKAMEIDAFARVFNRIIATGANPKSILEVGCGNGHNCLSLAKQFEAMRFRGVDFIPEMVASAQQAQAEEGIDEGRLSFAEDNVLELNAVEDKYDIIYSDRCLINLNTDELQMQAITSLCDHLDAGGHLLMIENSQQTYARQNQARELLGLKPRKPAEFNHFFDDDVLIPHLKSLGMEIVEVEDFISLHDLMLYVFVPLMNEGEVDYEHPLVQAATQLNIAASSEMRSAFGGFGQNRLYICKKL